MSIFFIRLFKPLFNFNFTGWQEQLQSASLNGESSLDQSTISKKQTLEDLYRPPLDIMFRGSLESVSQISKLLLFIFCLIINFFLLLKG